MSDLSTKRMIRAYFEEPEPTDFLSNLFVSPAENFHSTETIEFDIVRNNEPVAVVIEGVGTGYRYNSLDKSTNKEFTPPVYKEAVPLNAFELLKREPGVNPFENDAFRGKLIMRMFRATREIERKIRRSIELQASQVMQTGLLDLKDEAGVTRFTADFKPKATHFPTAGIAWNAGGATIAADIESLASVIRTDGKMRPDQLIIGADSYEAFITDADIIQRFDIRRADQGSIAPSMPGTDGGQLRGFVQLGHYQYEIWTYDGQFTDPQTGNALSFVDDAKCIVRAKKGRMDMTFGAIPNIRAEIGGVGSQLLPELPGRMSSEAGRIDLFTNVWMSDDGEQIFAGVGARPMAIPTAIDTYGAIATGV